MTEEQVERLLSQYKRLIHKVLLSTGISMNQYAYEDYYQELSIKLVEIADSFQGDVFDADKFKFASFAQRGLRWFLVDLFRSKKYGESTVPLSDYLLNNNESDEVSDKVIDFLNEASLRLDDTEILLFKGLVSGLPLNELAKTFGVSRKTISRRRIKLQEKLREIKDLLI
ncbi:sigma-70 family RNA polymerase sigma factor [Aerococcaceae bacterium DSM 111176]|nr:sigma-70 family RNA polymerase sigma factor [Aerococcaceae bacterium DSM 111176]